MGLSEISHFGSFQRVGGKVGSCRDLGEFCAAIFSQSWRQEASSTKSSSIRLRCETKKNFGRQQIAGLQVLPLEIGNVEGCYLMGYVESDCCS